jgi:amino acid permease
MQIADSELFLAILVAVLVTLFVYMYSAPASRDTADGSDNTLDAVYSRSPARLFKVFVVAFCVSYLIFYFVHDSKGDSPLENIYRCEPDF